jgi:hypothetical protein
LEVRAGGCLIAYEILITSISLLLLWLMVKHWHLH